MNVFIFLNLLFLEPFLISTLCVFIKSRYSRKDTVLIFSCVNTLTFVTICLNICLIGYSFVRPYNFILLLSVNLLFTLFVSSRRDFRAFFPVLLIISFSMAIYSFYDVLITLTVSPTIATIISILIYGILSYFLLSWLAPIILKLMDELPDIWLTLCLIPFSFIVLHFLLVIYPCSLNKLNDIIPAVIALILIQWFIYYFIFKFYIHFLNIVEEKRNILSTNTQTALVKSQETLVLEKEKKVRIFRHDTRHFIQLISSCLENNDIGEAKKTLQQLGSQIETETHITKYCNILSLNGVISHYANRAKTNNIVFDIDVKLPKNFSLDDMSLAIVLSNALENAFHACLKITDGQKPSMSLSCTYKNEQLFIEVQNTYSGKIFFDENGKLPISMDERHGIGIRSISSFAQSHNALLDYSTESGIFTMHMLLYMKD